MRIASSFRLFVSISLTLVFALATGCSLMPRKSEEHARRREVRIAQIDSIYKENALDHFLNGTVHEEAGDYHQAAMQYQIALMYDPRAASIAVALGNLYQELGEEEAGIMILERTRMQKPGNEELLTALHEHYMKAGRVLGVLRTLEELRQVRRLEAKELLELGSIYRGLNSPEEAIGAYQEYLKHYESNVAVYENIAKAHLMLDNADAADTAFQRIAELDPDNAQVHFILGGFAFRKRQWVEAEQHFRDALKRDAGDIRYWTNLLITLNNQNMFREVVDLCTEAVMKFPDAAIFYDMMGGAYERLGKLDNALASLDKAIALDDSRVSPFLTKGFIYHQREEWQKAAEAYDEAVARDPENPLVLNNFAYMLAVADMRLDEAMEMVDKALEASPENASYIDTKGWILYRQGRHREALEKTKEAEKLEPDNPEVYEHLGHIYKALGDSQKAKEAWRKAAMLNPENEEYQRLAR